MSTSKGKLSKSKSARDVLFGSGKGKMKSIRNLMGSLHSAHNKSMGHIELSSDSEDEMDEFGQDSSQGSQSTRDNSSGGDASSRGMNGSLGRRESHKENLEGCHNAKGEPTEGGTKIRRLVTVQVEQDSSIISSPSPTSPTSVIPTLESSTGTEESPSPIKTKKLPSPRATSGRKPGASLQRANSIGTLLVGKDSTLPPSPQTSPPTTGRRKTSQALQKSKSLGVNQDVAGDPQEVRHVASKTRDSKSQRTLKRSGSTKSLRSSKGGKSSVRKSEDIELSLDVDGPRRSTRGFKKCKSSDDTKETNSQATGKKAEQSTKGSESLSDDGHRAPNSTSTRQERTAQKVKSLNAAKDSFKANTDKESSGRSSRKCNRVNSTASSTAKQASTQHSTKDPASTVRRGSLQHSIPGPATKTRASTQSAVFPKISRSKSTRSFKTSKDEPKSTRSERTQNRLSRSKSISGVVADTNQDIKSLPATPSEKGNGRHVRSTRSGRSSGKNRSRSVPRLVSEKGQRKRCKSKSRDVITTSKKSEGESASDTVRARSHSRRAPSKSNFYSSSPNLKFDLRSEDQSESGRRTKGRSSANDCAVFSKNGSDSTPSGQGARTARSHSRRSVNRGFHASLPSMGVDLGELECEHDKDEKIAERDNQPSLPARKKSSKSTRRQINDCGSKDKESSTDADTGVTGERVNGRPRIHRGRQRKGGADKPKRKRSKSLKGLKDLRTKLGHSSGPMLSPKGCNQSITSGSISSLTMSSRLFSHDDYSFASSQKSPYRRSYSTPKLFVAGELSSSLLIEGDEMTEEQPDNRMSRWESLPQSKERQSMDSLPVVPDRDVSSYAGLLESSSLHRSVSDGGRCWPGSDNNNSSCPKETNPNSATCTSFCRAPDTPGQSVHSNTGLISELTPGTFVSPATRDSSHKTESPQRKGSRGEGNKRQRDFFASFSNLLFEDTAVVAVNRKGDSIPRRVRRHSFDSVTSFPTSAEQSGSEQQTKKTCLSQLLDAENDNAPKKPARRTSTGSSVQYVSSHSRKGVYETRY